ncbi:MAG: serine/threonine-protein kinase [Coleofasciculus sp. G3-WIS-01]|uniref:GUN4 domain-containing protein n=1 Tax=Coleofasciculus sp. G3-WIS-01 TaxID=3069528 RepID=UPI0032FF235D
MVWVSGQVLQGGKYTIEKKLGDGGFGITYLAKDKKGNPVVIKTLKAVDPQSPDFDKCQQEFINEALRLKGCQHSHIVKVYEVIKEDFLWGIVMEYIEGKDLGSLGKLPESEALRYIQQISEALTVVHNNGLLHRDVKPQNIIVRTSQSEAILIDFGIAREFTPNLTQTHTALFTPFYAPPEQYNPRAKRGAYTDVYGLAATLYRVLTGQEPESSVSRVMGCPLAPPKQLNSTISDVVNQAILKGLELQPENRPQSVREWIQLLISQNSADDLSSESGIDYRQLRDLLAAGEWKQADTETANKMLAVIGKKSWYDVIRRDVEKFPCTDLRTIDCLWVKYSNGHFGFSVQKRIWHRVGGQPSVYDHDIYKKFGDTVGWREKDDWLEYDNLTFSLNTPHGHLPTVLSVGWFISGAVISSLSLRLAECNI